ncbi:MAG: hypothetical protein M3O22_01300 [Pseudomonadota bacterium]|nr:hypothetical protein [Pseudomonadota bacterium]
MRLYPLTTILAGILAVFPFFAKARTATTQMTVSAVVVDGVEKQALKERAADRIQVSLENDILEGARKIMADYGFRDVRNLRLQGDFVHAESIAGDTQKTLTVNVYNGTLSVW